MLRDEFRNILKSLGDDFTLEEIKNAIEKVLEGKKKKSEESPSKEEKREDDKVVKSFLEKVNFRERVIQHPLVWKAIETGILKNASKRYEKSDAYKRIRNKLAEVLEKQRVEVKDLEELCNLLRELRDEVIDFIEERVSDVKEGLRYIHAPGSVAKSKARNLYFGERFTTDDLYKLALRLCSSIAFGDSIGIYSEDEEFMRYMKQFVGDFQLGLSSVIEKEKLEEIGIQEHDTDHPYVVLLKFIMWLRKHIDVEEDPERREICLSILDMLPSTTINMFFMPGKEIEKWCTIFIPRLDFFINNWIQRDKRRENLDAFVKSIDNLIKDALRESKKKKEGEKARNSIDILMNNYEILCRRLIEYGIPDFYALRNIMDIVVDLSTRYGIRFRFESLMLAV
ncbi:MAG: hypothetical protein NDP13_01315 [Crenarchaeota archaeon]|nr:hypothetical protein [Thermoproteota archaeon]